ncbi:MAG: hypothetical protein HY077_08715 [Elusimicrobia bacterium]|nr:hypothetical protein [Elusimicrobiota bacterium]
MIEIPWTWTFIRRKARRWGPAVICVGLTGTAVAYFASSLPQAYRYFQYRAPMRAMAREAAKTGLEYDDAVKNPAAVKGKPVRWFITHPGHFWFCGDNQNRPILWSGAPPAMMETGQNGSSHGRWVLATVDSVEPRGVVLDFHGFD